MRCPSEERGVAALLRAGAGGEEVLRGFKQEQVAVKQRHAAQLFLFPVHLGEVQPAGGILAEVRRNVSTEIARLLCEKHDLQLLPGRRFRHDAVDVVINAIHHVTGDLDNIGLLKQGIDQSLVVRRGHIIRPVDGSGGRSSRVMSHAKKWERRVWHMVGGALSMKGPLLVKLQSQPISSGFMISFISASERGPECKDKSNSSSGMG